MKEITRETAERVLASLEAGRGFLTNEELPAEARVAEPVAHLVEGLYGLAWSSKDEPAKSMRRLAVAQLGSEEVVEEKEFRSRVGKMLVRSTLSHVLRIVAAWSRTGDREELAEAAYDCEREPTRANGERAARLLAEHSEEFSDFASHVRGCIDSPVDFANALKALDVISGMTGVRAGLIGDRILKDFSEGLVQILNSSVLNGATPGCECLRLNSNLAPLPALERQWKIAQIGLRVMSLNHKARSGGVLFSDGSGEPRAFLVQNRHGDEPFFVSCTKANGQMRYMHALSECDQEFLGVWGLTYTEEHDVARGVAGRIEEEIARKAEQAGTHAWRVTYMDGSRSVVRGKTYEEAMTEASKPSRKRKEWGVRDLVLMSQDKRLDMERAQNAVHQAGVVGDEQDDEQESERGMSR